MARADSNMHFNTIFSGLNFRIALFDLFYSCTQRPTLALSKVGKL
jgi:hypothetical protein